MLADGHASPSVPWSRRGSRRILHTLPIAGSAAARMPYLSMSPAILAAFIASTIRACKSVESASKAPTIIDPSISGRARRMNPAQFFGRGSGLGVPGRNRAADNRCAELIWCDRSGGSAIDQQGMLRIRDRLQAIEDELVAADLDEVMVAFDAGTSSGTSHCTVAWFPSRMRHVIRQARFRLSAAQ
jgi:hypothetical protein